MDEGRLHDRSENSMDLGDRDALETDRMVKNMDVDEEDKIGSARARASTEIKKRISPMRRISLLRKRFE